jgi:hypothetical protein
LKRHPWTNRRTWNFVKKGANLGLNLSETTVY